MSDIDHGCTVWHSGARCVLNKGHGGFHEIPNEAAAILAERDNLRDELARKNTRIEELLAAMVRLTNSTPFSDEAKDALEQRGKLVAEIGTLKQRVAELERSCNRKRYRCLACGSFMSSYSDFEEFQHDGCGLVVDVEEAIRLMDKREKERDSARAELARMRPVIAMVRDDLDQAVAAHDSSDPRHRSHGGQHHNGPCCEFGALTPGAVRHMRRLRDAITAALNAEKQGEK